jgi:polysaccharide deacetylase family protein (PEP-CTERM system associated)
MRNFLTVDVEEHFQVEGFADVVRRGDWESHDSRVRPQTQTLLDLLESTRQRATFFVLGWTAERHPLLVLEIVARGHEVASHGWSHLPIDAQGARWFRRDVRRAKRVLEDILGAPVAGYRAPTFSITRRTPWAHRILCEEGFAYSSSVFPIRHDRYGVPDAPRLPHHVDCGNGRTIVELPPLTVRLVGTNLPVAGGGYLRVLPAALVSRAIRAMNRIGAPAVVYLHSWEMDPAQPRIAGRASAVWRHRVGLAGFPAKLRKLLDAHEFVPIGEMLGLPDQLRGAAPALERAAG